MAAQAAIHDKLPQAEGFEGILLPLAALNRIRMPDCCTFVVDGRLRGHDEVYENRIGSGVPTIHAISPNRSAQPLSEPALRP